jgi:hypothetical protein
MVMVGGSTEMWGLSQFIYFQKLPVWKLIDKDENKNFHIFTFRLNSTTQAEFFRNGIIHF